MLIKLLTQLYLLRSEDGYFELVNIIILHSFSGRQKPSSAESHCLSPADSHYINIIILQSFSDRQKPSSAGGRCLTQADFCSINIIILHSFSGRQKPSSARVAAYLRQILTM